MSGRNVRWLDGTRPMHVLASPTTSYAFKGDK